jgi:hypothetical protein
MPFLVWQLLGKNIVRAPSETVHVLVLLFKLHPATDKDTFQSKTKDILEDCHTLYPIFKNLIVRTCQVLILPKQHTSSKTNLGLTIPYTSPLTPNGMKNTHVLVHPVTTCGTTPKSGYDVRLTAKTAHVSVRA